MNTIPVPMRVRLCALWGWASGLKQVGDLGRYQSMLLREDDVEIERIAHENWCRAHK